MTTSRTIVAGCALLALGASIVPGCGDDECISETGCGVSLRVEFDPVIDADGEVIEVEATLDGEVLRCRQDPANAKPPSETCDFGLGLDDISDRARGLDVHLPRTPKMLTVRVLRGGGLVRETTFTPTYVQRDPVCGKCMQANAVKM